MNTRTTFTWGVVPGRQVGAVTKRFHKRRVASDAEAAVGKMLGLPQAEARRRLRYAQAESALTVRDASRIEHDWLLYHALKREADAKAADAANKAEAARVARVAAYLESTMGNQS